MKLLFVSLVFLSGCAGVVTQSAYRRDMKELDGALAPFVKDVGERLNRLEEGARCRCPYGRHSGDLFTVPNLAVPAPLPIPSPDNGIRTPVIDPAWDRFTIP